MLPYLLYNGQLQASNETALGLDNRGFNYGDGLFETLFGSSEGFRWAPRHLERLLKGLSLLGMAPLAELNEETLEAGLHKACRASHYQGPLKGRLQAWRKPGGAFAPQSGQAEWLLTLFPAAASYRVRPIGDVGFAQTTTAPGPLAFAKRMSALPYVLAGLEKNQAGWEEIVLCSPEGYLAEGLQSNLFWRAGGVWHTPPLSTGCVAGIARARVLEHFRSQGQACYESQARPAALRQAEGAFFCNAGGFVLPKGISSQGEFAIATPKMEQYLPLAIFE